jgi:hypothetical protein
MGYFDALTSSYFKTGQDGRKLFFPWGVIGRGYVIPSEEHYERLRKPLKLYMIVSLTAIIGAAIAFNTLTTLALGGAFMVFYAVWSRQLLRGLSASDERLLLKESMTTQALTHGSFMLWTLQIASLLLVASGVTIFFIDPAQWPMALAVIVFFGFCAVFIARMLILRRRAAAIRA